MKKKHLQYICITILIISLIACTTENAPNEEQAEAQTEGAAEQEDVPTAVVVEEEAEEPEGEIVEPIFGDALTEPIPVIFSHDGASDDFATLIYITRHPMIDLIGVVQSYGIQHPGKTLAAWQTFLYDVIDYDDAVFGLGSEDPLDPQNNHFPDGWRTGTDAFFGLELPAASDTYTAENGADVIIDLVKNSPEKVTMLVTGAQTDMALAIQKDPSISENISQIVIMGGAFEMNGNLYESPGHEDNEVAEWNIYVDPLAAKIVFNSGIPLSIVSLDGSHFFFISPDDNAKISDVDDAALSLLSTLWEQQFVGWGGDFKIWDIVAAVSMTNPEVVDWTYDTVDVVADPGNTHGQTIGMGIGSETARYSASTDYDLVRELLFDVLLSGQ